MNPFRKAAVAAALVGSTVAGGAIGAAFVSGSATADTSSSSTTPAAATAPAAATPPAGQPRQGNFDPSKGGHTANGITEALLTGDTADKVKAAALAAVPGGTVQRVENDAEGSPYEAHVTKSDGTQVTVKVDSSFKVTNIVNGAG